MAYLLKKESEIGIKCIQFNQIPVKSPDPFPMDSCTFRLLMRALRKQHSEQWIDFGKRSKRNGVKMTWEYYEKVIHETSELEILSRPC